MGLGKSRCCGHSEINAKKNRKRSKGEKDIEDNLEEIYEHYLQWKSMDDALSQNLDENQMKSLFTCLTYTIRNYVGMPEEPYNSKPSELTEFCSSLFKVISNSEKEELAHKVKGMRPLHVELIVTLKSANNLIPSDPNGLSDPYCKLWVTKDNTVESKVIKKSLNPEWNQTFTFKLKNLNEDKLHLEMWDYDPKDFASAFCEIRNINGVGGCLSWLRDLARNIFSCCIVKDDFLGLIYIPVNTISSSRAEQKFNLVSKISEEATHFGAVNLKLLFKVKVLETPFNMFLSHAVVTKLFLDYSLWRNRKSIAEKKYWTEVLPQPALTLLYQHSLQGCVNTLEATICWWIVCFYTTKQNKRIPTALLYTLLQIIYKMKETKAFSIDENIDKTFMSYLYECLEHCKNVLKKFRKVFTLENDEGRQKFRDMLKCLLLTTEFISSDITTNINNLIKEEFKKWDAESFKEVTYDRSRREMDCKIVLRQLNLATKNLKALDKEFGDVWKNSYTSIIYEEMDSLLEKKIKGFIQTLSSNFNDCDPQDIEGSISYLVRIYMAVRSLKLYIVEQLSSERRTLSVERFHEWFGEESLFEWYDWLKNDSKLWIKNSVEMEDMLRVDDRVYCGASALDTIKSIHQRFVTLWTNLSWPDTEATLKMVHTVIELCYYYISETEKKVWKNEFYDNEGRFDISEELCVAISNFSEIANYSNTIENVILKYTPDDLKPSISIAVHKLDELGTNVINGIAVLCNDAITKMKKEIEHDMKEITIATHDQKQQMLLMYFYDYIRSNIKMASVNLGKEPFLVLAKDMWSALLDCAEGEIHYNQGFLAFIKGKHRKYSGLKKAMINCKDIFCSEGVDKFVVEDPRFSSLISKLEKLINMDT